MAYHEGVIYPTYQWVFMDRVISDFVATEFSYDDKYYRCSETQMVNASVNASVSFFLDLATSKDADITFSGQSYDDFLRSYQEEANA